MCPPTDHEELDTLPQEIMTIPSPWDPSILDDDHDTDDDDFFDSIERPDVSFHDHLDEYGDYRDVHYTKRFIVSQTIKPQTLRSTSLVNMRTSFPTAFTLTFPPSLAVRPVLKSSSGAVLTLGMPTK
jgi:hypothetical protein